MCSRKQMAFGDVSLNPTASAHRLLPVKRSSIFSNASRSLKNCLCPCPNVSVKISRPVNPGKNLFR